MMGLGMGLGWLMMIVFWVGLIALGVWLVRALFPRAGQPPRETQEVLSARDILDRRFARGEIGHAEYEAMRETLSDEKR